MRDPDEYLNDDPSPTINQVAWVFAHLDNAMIEIGSYRYLIYDRMGFGPNAYQPLYEAGGMNLTNGFHDLRTFEDKYGSIPGGV